MRDARPSARRVAALAALLLALPLAQAAPYLQHEVDATRTGTSSDAGPASFDVALSVPLPVRPASRSPILVVDGAVYALLGAVETENAASVVRNASLVRVGLHDAVVETLLTFDDLATSVASDGERFFVAEADALRAYRLPGTTPAWSVPYPADLGLGGVRCAPLAVADGSVFAACSRSAAPRSSDAAVGDPSEPPAAFVLAVDGASGAVAWTWRKPYTQPGAVSPPPPSPDVPYVEPEPFVPHALLVARERVVVSGVSDARNDEDVRGNDGSAQAYAIDRATGATAWRIPPAPMPTSPGVRRVPQDTPETALATDGQTLFFLAWELSAFDLETGRTLWSRSLAPAVEASRVEPPTDWPGTALALAAGRLYAASFGALHALDVTQSPAAEVWRTPIPSGDWEGTHSLLLVNGTLYAGGHRMELFATEATTGRVLFRDDRPGQSQRGLRIAAGDSVVAYLAPTDATLRVLGRTNASIQLGVSVNDAYAAPGERVVLDLTSTRPGLQAADTEFAVDWGDDSPVSWEAATLHEHVYDRAGPRTVVVHARNAAGQTASVVLDLDIGGVAPQAPTLLERAFARDNQDTTWGVIGLALAAGGGFVALGRSRTRRRRLQRELAAIDQAFAANRARVRECEAALVERRAHVQGLGLDGRLEQADVVLLTQRIDELARELRVGTIDREFHFLPHGFVLSLKEMLADGTISVWEHEHLVHALERDRTMTPEQKDRVRAVLAEWAERDERPPR